MLELITFTLGPVQTNAYLVADTKLKQAVVIDPAWDGHLISEEATRQGWSIQEIWLTHAHFDHIAGANVVVASTSSPVKLALHPADLSLYNMQGGALLFGMQIETGPVPEIALSHQSIMKVGNYVFEVRHTPGHTPGHVIFYCAQEKVVFCGDVIFQGSIGRTDLPGGNYQALINSIQTQIFVLPDEVRLFSGHGPATTVGIERAYNPYFA